MSKVYERHPESLKRILLESELSPSIIAKVYDLSREYVRWLRKEEKAKKKPMGRPPVVMQGYIEPQPEIPLEFGKYPKIKYSVYQNGKFTLIYEFTTTLHSEEESIKRLTEKVFDCHNRVTYFKTVDGVKTQINISNENPVQISKPKPSRKIL